MKSTITFALLALALALATAWGKTDGRNAQAPSGTCFLAQSCLPLMAPCSSHDQCCSHRCVQLSGEAQPYCHSQ